ncbi:carbohydrate sulfotransferase 14-like [Patiria miniata]|uniref:Carbohydrate sulfotransferase n=1 Tax=Patiria miniata TaxID=46514 RepID=A0A913ZZA4_PATMI|nr:carbohydrate sulfotransferase 14-like [Patiria miniata]
MRRYKGSFVIDIRSLFTGAAASACHVFPAMSTKAMRRFLAWFVFTIATTVVFFLGIFQGVNTGWRMQYAEAMDRPAAAAAVGSSTRHGPLRRGILADNSKGIHQENETTLKLRLLHLRNGPTSEIPTLDYTHGLQKIENSSGNSGDTLQNITRAQIIRSIRNHTIHSICQAEQLSDVSMLDRTAREELTHQIIVDDERKFLYCYVPKVACSNWKRVIKFMQGTIQDIGAKIKMDHKNGLVFLDSFTPKQIKYRIKNYYKFMFVRNPVERLLSAYRNKFGEEALSQYKQRYAPRIIHKYRGKWDGKDTNITLEEFVRYLLDTGTAKMDQHWKPMHLLCQPCAVQYDFVGSFEQLSEDSNYVLDKIKGNTGAYFPPRQGWYNPTTQDKMDALISEVDPIYIQKFVDKYILDFITFGYAPPKQYYLKYNQDDGEDDDEENEENEINPRGSNDS